MTRPGRPTEAPPLLLRERDAANVLGISPTLLRRQVRNGRLTRVPPDDTTRAVRYIAAEVYALGESWIARARAGAGDAR